MSGIFRFFVTYWVKPVRFREGLNSFSIFFTSQLILLGSITQWKRLSYDGYVYPDWAQAVAWLLALCSFVAIPVRAITEIVHHKGSFREVRSKLYIKVKRSKLYIICFNILYIQNISPFLTGSNPRIKCGQPNVKKFGHSRNKFKHSKPSCRHIISMLESFRSCLGLCLSYLSCSTLQRLMRAVRADVSVLNAVGDRHNLRPQR